VNFEKMHLKTKIRLNLRIDIYAVYSFLVNCTEGINNVYRISKDQYRIDEM